MRHVKELLARALREDAFQEIARRLQGGGGSLAVAGAAGGTKALAIAHAALAASQSMTVITATGQEARALADGIRFFLGLLAESPPRVTLLPGPEVDPYRGLSPHPEVAAARAEALWRLLQDERVVCVTPVHSAALRLHAPQRFLESCMDLRAGGDYDPEEVRRRLQETGYVEDDPVTEPGEFSLRGGILDVFPAHLESPVRLEFFGDRLESLRAFDPESQRSIGPVEGVQVIPMREQRADADTLRRWAEEFPARWSEAYLPYIDEELSRARCGEPFPAFEFLLPAVDPLESTLFDYLRGHRLAVCEREIVEATLDKCHAELYARYADRIESLKPVLQPDELYLKVDRVRECLARFPCLEVEELGIEGGREPPVRLAVEAARRYHGNIGLLISDLNKAAAGGESLILIFSSLGRAERLRDILREYEIPAHLCRDPECPETWTGGVLLGTGSLHTGFYLRSPKLRVLTGSEIFGEVEAGAAPRPGRARRLPFLSDFRDLKPGDYVVHVDHGIGLFQGLQQIRTQEGIKEFVLLAYQDGARLYVPVERLDLLQKYSSLGGARPSLDRLGGTSWHRTKARIRKSMRDMAGELLRLYAERRTVEGFAFSADGAWQREFEDAFEFELTRDQEDATEAVKHDMEAPRPMDRLICGDVGYGKTEVAMRAAFKAVMDGKQVAVLAPTTVLAFQHFNTFRRRFTAFPVRIELLSRFRSRKEQKAVLADLETGAVDIVIGTHRLLSKDVRFRDLGLVVVDEEQRFGVAHKERLKALKTRVDVLTLSATPIPRTLHMALTGLRDMSTIETPPKNRLAIQTSVLRFSPDVIRSAIELELARSGQVYYVHNRVETIYPAAAMIQRLVPQARIGVAHGQMSERELERVMLRFVMNELDVLVATTIIENGLDIPRVNTIIIDRADLYGMSQLYQLRGRVGRSDRRAYAYLLVPAEEALSEVARKRLAAIREFSDLGTGFRVAALDLEIRGAGNMLGREQSGHINAVGFDLYCRLLEQTVQELQGLKEEEEEISANINLNLDIRIPDDYIADQSQRLQMYKRISSARDAAELEELRGEMVDRFGRCPAQVDNLFHYAALRLYALELGIQSIERHRHQIFFRMSDRSKISPHKLLKTVRRHPQASFSPQGVLTLEADDLPPAELFASIRRILDAIRA